MTRGWCPSCGRVEPRAEVMKVVDECDRLQRLYEAALSEARLTHKALLEMKARALEAECERDKRPPRSEFRAMQDRAEKAEARADWWQHYGQKAEARAEKAEQSRDYHRDRQRIAENERDAARKERDDLKAAIPTTVAPADALRAVREARDKALKEAEAQLFEARQAVLTVGQKALALERQLANSLTVDEWNKAAHDLKNERDEAIRLLNVYHERSCADPSSICEVKRFLEKGGWRCPEQTTR